MKRKSLRRMHRMMLAGVAAFPLCQFFSGCFPNIPGIPNLAGAANLELTNLLNRVIIDTISVVVSNLLNL